jgi:hypothetical protein
MDVEKRVEDDRLLEAQTVDIRISMFATRMRLWREEQAVDCVLKNDIYIIVLNS